MFRDTEKKKAMIGARLKRRTFCPRMSLPVAGHADVVRQATKDESKYKRIKAIEQGKGKIQSFFKPRTHRYTQ